MKLGYKNNIAWQRNQQAILKTAGLIGALPARTPYKNIAGQLFSAVSSIGANIAEGYSDFEGNEYQRYLKISLRSAYETDHWLTTVKSLASESDRISLTVLEEIEGLNSETIKILTKTIQSIKKKRTGLSG